MNYGLLFTNYPICFSIPHIYIYTCNYIYIIIQVWVTMATKQVTMGYYGLLWLLTTQYFLGILHKNGSKLTMDLWLPIHLLPSGND